MVQWLARLPGTQEIRGSSPGRGMTDFCTSIFICNINKSMTFIQPVQKETQTVHNGL